MVFQDWRLKKKRNCPPKWMLIRKYFLYFIFFLNKFNPILFKQFHKRVEQNGQLIPSVNIFSGKCEHLTKLLIFNFIILFFFWALSLSMCLLARIWFVVFFFMLPNCALCMCVCVPVCLYVINNNPQCQATKQPSNPTIQPDQLTNQTSASICFW